MFKINSATNTLRTQLRPKIGGNEPSVWLWGVDLCAGYRTVRRKWGDNRLKKELRPVQNWDFGDFRYDLCLNWYFL